MSSDGSHTKPQELQKILILGLGTSGTDICNLLAERLNNEFGSVERVPWIRFLCMETDAAKGGLIAQMNNMVRLTISEDQYQSMLSNPKPFDDAIQFTKYWNINTLKQIPNVTAGVGNVRMAGRLTLFYPENYETVMKRLGDEVSILTKLSPLDAKRQRGSLPDGSDPEIVFLGEQEVQQGPNKAKPIVIVVVGTLCGGTCSGLCVDMGFLLQHTFDQTHVMAFFTLPNPTLNAAQVSDAERYKANAYSALQELHHFCQVAENTYRAKYPFSPEIELRSFPYELAMLAWPGKGESLDVEALNYAIAERLFLLSYSGTDPFARVINQERSFLQNGHLVHTMFGTMGLSTLEYPAPRLVENCAYRLQQFAMEKWVANDPSDLEIGKAMRDIGISQNSLFEIMDGAAGGLTQRLDVRVTQALNKLTNPRSNFLIDLDQIDQALGIANGASPDELGMNYVPLQLQGCRDQVLDIVEHKLWAWLQPTLIRWEAGPNYCARVLGKMISDMEHSLGSTNPPPPDSGPVRFQVQNMQELCADPMVRITHLNSRVRHDISVNIGIQLRGYIRKKIEFEKQRILRDYKAPNGTVQNGLLRDIIKTLNRVKFNLEHVATACRTHAELCQKEAARLDTVPRINGQILMVEGDGAKIYQRIVSQNGSLTELDAAQAAKAGWLLSQWSTLFDETAPVKAYFERAVTLSTADQTTLMRTAKDVFAEILHDDVLSLWADRPDAQAIAEKLAKGSKFFIETVNTLSPGDKKSFAVFPGADVDSDRVRQFRKMSGCDTKDWQAITSSSNFRASLLSELHQIALANTPGIVIQPGVQSLEAAEFNKWSTYSRLNPDGWQPISDSQLDGLQECKELLAVAIILDVIGVKMGNLICSNYPAVNFGQSTVRSLPNDLNKAARMWAIDKSDLNQLELTHLETTLKTSILNLKQNSELTPEGVVRRLRDNLSNSGTGMENWDPAAVSPLLRSFCMKDAELRQYYITFTSASASLQNTLWYVNGQSTVSGRRVEQSGYYCINPACGSFIGATKEEVEQNEWMCKRCSAIYSTEGCTYKPEWLDLVARTKTSQPQVYSTPIVTQPSAAEPEPHDFNRA